VIKDQVSFGSQLQYRLAKGGINKTQKGLAMPDSFSPVKQ
jgi:hypothetical protein